MSYDSKLMDDEEEDKPEELDEDSFSEHSSDDFSGSSESDEPILWTGDDEVNFLRTLSALKERDPKIYDNEMRFFRDDGGSNSAGETVPKTEKKKRRENGEIMTLQDYERKLAMERGGQLGESETDEADWNVPGTSSYMEQEMELKQAFKNAYASDSDESDSESLLKKRVKTADERIKEEEDYYEWLKDKGRGGPEIFDKDLKRLKERWSKDANLDEDEKFLRDYLLNKEYENGGDEAEEEERIPTYEELIQEDEDDDMAEQFEQKYNFRFEDPDQEFLKQYPRTVKEALRKPDSKRKRKRKQQKEGKEKATIDGVDVPFRYRTVVPNSFGLTTEEILNSEDRWLNAWAPVSKMSQYRSDEQEQRQLMYFQRKAQDKETKGKILQQNSQMEAKSAGKEHNDNDADNDEVKNTPKKRNKKSKRGRLKKDGKIEIEHLGMERLKAYGVSMKKLKRVQYVKKMAENGSEKTKKRKEESDAKS